MQSQGLDWCLPWRSKSRR